MSSFFEYGGILIVLLLVIVGPPIASWYYGRRKAFFTILLAYGIYGALFALAFYGTEDGAGAEFLAIIAVPYLIVTMIVANVVQKQSKP